MNLSLNRQRLIELRKLFFSALGLHLALFSVMAITTIALTIRVGLDWRTTSASSQDELASTQTRMRTLQMQLKPLAGLDKRVEASRRQIDSFYVDRIPPNYSSIAAELGTLASQSSVRLTRVEYSQTPGSVDLTEIRMDAGLNGDYPSIMRFINGIERSKTFFIIRAMALTGQQGGQVALRLQMSTWLRPADAAASGLPQAKDAAQDAARDDAKSAHTANQPTAAASEGN